MHRLTLFELEKIWCRRSFLFPMLMLLLLNLFLLWYVTIPGEEEPALHAYKEFENDISDMSESEKSNYLAGLKETIDGVAFVSEVLAMQNISGEMGEALVKQSMQSQPGRFEEYYGIYSEGSYLKYTDSLEKEKALIDELYAEQTKAASYDAYLQEVQENKDILGGISIFAKDDKATFSSRNIQKSAADYAGLNGSQICWSPSKPIRLSMESRWTDLFLLLSVFLFVGALVVEEKEKRLFYITRCTKKGIVHSMVAKLLSLLAHCVFLTFIFYGLNLAFIAHMAGLPDLTVPVQSLAPYMESSLSISISGYILCSVFTKGIVLFGIGAILTALCIFLDNIYVPYIIGIGVLGVSWLLNTFMPAGTAFNTLKYLNFMGFLENQMLYGAYLNLNIFGFPVSRLALSWLIIFLVGATGAACSIKAFVKGSHFEMKSKRGRTFRFCPHTCLLRYEGYKIMVVNRALFILLFFGLIIGYYNLQKEYRPSVYEQYYQNIMLQLEGELTDEKEALILSEQARYEEAFGKIRQIDDMLGNGTISEDAADTLKAEWNAVAAFYPVFEKVERQYRTICESGGTFIYDSGYLYLFGNTGDSFLIDLLLLTIGMIFSFSNTIPMEYQINAWAVLNTTKQGKRKVIALKYAVCLMLTAILTIVPVACRYISILSVYPLNGLSFSIRSIPRYYDFVFDLPVWGFILIFVLGQLLSVMLITLVVLLVSDWRKDHVQTIFFSMLLLAIPLILKLLGFSFSGWFSVYPIYSWTA